MGIMLGRCYQRLGQEDQARANFDRAVQLQGGLRDVADERINGDSNVLLVVDFSHGPRKYTTADGSIVGLGPTPQQVGPVPLPLVMVDHRAYPIGGANRPPVDLLALAQDRKWQSIDTIRAVKSAVGTGLIAAGAIHSATTDYHHQVPALDLGLIAGATYNLSVQAITSTTTGPPNSGQITVTT